jgi:hypothetical protein
METVNFQYRVDEFKICMAGPPTKAPTVAPTTGPENHYCPGNQYWNGAAGRPMIDSGLGNWACNHKEWGNSHPMKGVTGWNSGNSLQKLTKYGPTQWKLGGVPKFDQTPTNANNKKNGGCRGFCEFEEGMSGDENDIPSLDCKTDYTSFHGERICAHTDQGGYLYFKEEQSAGNAYLTANCHIITSGTTRKGGGKSGKQCCSKMMVWDEAKKFCSYTGGRLCTVDELANSCTERSGCDYDYTFIWTSTRCNVAMGVESVKTFNGETSPRDYSNQLGYYAMPGDQKKWQRKAPGDCIFKTDPNDKANGHKACTEAVGWGDAGHANYGLYQQGMMNSGDSVPNAIKTGYGARTGMGATDSGYSNRASAWIHTNTGVNSRYRYTDAIKDLFGWDSGDDVFDGGSHPLNRPNPFNFVNGKVCLPAAADTDYPVFVRCCGDYVTNIARSSNSWPEDMYCLDCPGGTFNAAGNGKDFYTCQPGN